MKKSLLFLGGTLALSAVTAIAANEWIYRALIYGNFRVPKAPGRALSEYKPVDGKEKLSAAEGNGPVNAMDKALRQVLSAFYPVIDKMKLTDFKVRVSSGGATASVVRVIIESTDGRSVWRTVGVSPDIINASWQAMCDAVEYMLRMREA